MEDNSIELKVIEQLLGLNFFIPSYQRGYRWTEVQVRDLLYDLDHFINRSSKDQSDFYCLQPLVVKETIPNIDVFIEALPKKSVTEALEITRTAIIKNTEIPARL